MFIEWKTGNENVHKIQEYIEDHQALLCVLTGEVGGFSHAQQSALAYTINSPPA